MVASPSPPFVMIGKNADVEYVEVILELATSCTDANADERPSMNQVLQILEQEVMSPCPSDFYESHHTQITDK